MKYNPEINKDTGREMIQHALDEYPEECCGILTGRGGDQTVHRCTNIQNRVNAEDPARFPRDARTAYMIERHEFDAIVASARERGEDILAFYHSHTEHEAYFSEEDVAAQTVFGEPEFPDAVHIVMSIIRGGLHDIKCFRWDDPEKRFVSVDISF